MPHLVLDYPPDLAELVEMGALCAVLRDAMVATGLFPLGGIRVRGRAAECWAIADGSRQFLYLDLVLRMGTGRSEADRARAMAEIYDAARAFLEPRVGDVPTALSMEIIEIDPVLSDKRWNTIHGYLARRE
ncbi:MAG: 5-carboxymethyl-2-hydroxymuconate isomerase [Rhodobacteraceae bacterium]|nr:5-carboxymethyl-2-hydroxymuconate isomerase [Paracoccaceae bacterium]